MCLVLPSALLSQETAEFEMPIYFEDARGNKDTIIIGYDTLATSDRKDYFDGQDDFSPFDSVFEVRASSHFDFFNAYNLSKKIIVRKKFPPTWVQGLCWRTDADIFLFIKNKYPPVKIRWDMELLASEHCTSASYMAWDRSDVLPPPWWVVSQRYECMAAVDGLSLELEEYPDWGNEILKTMNGVPTDTILGLRMVLQPPRTDIAPCANAVSTLGYNRPAVRLEVFPNPASDELGVEFDHSVLQTGKVKWVIRNVQGQALKRGEAAVGTGENSSARVSVTELHSGVYFLQIENDHGVPLGATRFVKM